MCGRKRAGGLARKAQRLSAPLHPCLYDRRHYNTHRGHRHPACQRVLESACQYTATPPPPPAASGLCIDAAAAVLLAPVLRFQGRYLTPDFLAAATVVTSTAFRSRSAPWNLQSTNALRLPARSCQRLVIKAPSFILRLVPLRTAAREGGQRCCTCSAACRLA